jgi:hypothetical protein
VFGFILLLWIKPRQKCLSSLARGIFRLVRNYQFFGYLVIVATLKISVLKRHFAENSAEDGTELHPFYRSFKGGQCSPK